MEMKKRSAYPLGMFDLLKGLGMIQIILFHTSSYVDSSDWLSSFLIIWGVGLMGCFYAVNGFQFRESPLKLTVKRPAKTYFSMYLRLATAVLICLLITDYRSVFPHILTFALGIFYPTMIGTIPSGTIALGWFLLALFWGNIFLNLILKIRKPLLRAICIILVAALGYVIELEAMGYVLVGIRLDYFALFRGCEMLPAMYLGYCTYTCGLLEKLNSGWKKWMPYLLFAVAVLICIVLNRENVPEWTLYFGILCEIIWGYTGMYFARDTVNCSNRILEMIRRIGRYSSWIVIVHTVEMICFPWWRVADWVSVIHNGNVQYLVLVLMRVVMIFLGCKLMEKVDKLERQWKRKRRSKKRTRQKVAL